MKKTIIEPLCYKNKIEFKSQVKSFPKIRDPVPEKYDVLRSVVFAIDTAYPE